MKPTVSDYGNQPVLVGKLLTDPACYDHPVAQLRLNETHISWVILTGDFAYKIKKPLDLGFLDFSTLALRKQACDNEVRLNRRLAPDYYLGVVAITGDDVQPRIGGDGASVEYAVKMKQFASARTLDHYALHGELQFKHVDAIALRLSRFHLQECEIAHDDSPWGNAELIGRPVLENFRVLEDCLDNSTQRAQLDRLRNWSLSEHKRLNATMRLRKRNGMIRECHGDLHLANLAWVNDGPLIFDCIEFNEALRWIDVISEVAFLFMDLLHRNLPGHAMRLLNAWLETTGDYEGIALLRYYTVYRAMVRAKIAALRLTQTEAPENGIEEVLSCLRLAEQLTQQMPTQLWITHGPSGSGKTTVSQRMLQQYGMIRIRSDVERKRLFGYQALQKTESKTATGIYNATATKRTYQHLAQLAGSVLKTGWPVIVDAAFLQRWQRDQLHEAALRNTCPFGIIDVRADIETMQQRVKARRRDGRDASEAEVAVLRHQLETECPLADDELAISTVNSSL